MGLDRLINTPTMEIDQSRYEELIRNELKYEQYKALTAVKLVDIIEASTKILDESEETDNDE